MFELRHTMQDDAVVAGTEGQCLIILPDGRRKVLANILSLEATVKYTKKEIVIMGRRVKPSKKGAGSLSGTMKMYYNTSVFREAAKAYKDAGKDSYYDLLIINHDEDSIVGQQRVMLYGVNFDEELIAYLDAESEQLTETKTFTFNDYELENVFNQNALPNV